ncbi:invasion associated locus B family protein [Algimonas porphyrae]|nr:invasion associated locus B family protein [Algimonas porphyrae]
MTRPHTIRRTCLHIGLSALIAISGAAMVIPAEAAANAPRLEGRHADWIVYTRGSGQAKTCYVVSEATTKSPGTANHGNIFFLVSNWANGAATEQPSLMTGFPLKPARAPKARVGSTAITMYGADNEAFIAETADERRLVASMRKGANMTVEAVSARGTDVSYNFSLKGVTAALRQAGALCR